jgi:hypothetical protein
MVKRPSPVSPGFSGKSSAARKMKLGAAAITREYVSIARQYEVNIS